MGDGPRGVFISYRQAHAPHVAGRLFEHLERRFGHDRVFLDVSSIPPGANFASAIRTAISDDCAVLLVLIGPRWLEARGGVRRIDAPDDPVRAEIVAGLECGVRIIPVLVDRVRMPAARNLPDDVRPLVDLQAVKLSHSSFKVDVQTLLAAVESVLTAPKHPNVRPDVRPDERPDVRPDEPFRLFEELPRIERRGFGPVSAVAFGSDGPTMAAGYDDGAVRLWDPAENENVPRQTVQGHTAVVRTVAFSSDSALLATAGADGTVCIWAARTGALLFRFDEHRDWVHAVAFRPFAGTLASVGDDRTVRLWDARSGEVLHRIGGHTRGVRAVAFRPDGRMLATGGGDGRVRLWWADTGASAGELEGHVQGVSAIAFGRGGEVLATGGDDGRLRLWHPGSGELLREVDVDRAGVRAVACPRDGEVVATAGAAGPVRLWDLGSGALRQELSQRGGAVRAVAFRPDGRSLVAAGSDRTLRLWAAADDERR